MPKIVPTVGRMVYYYPSKTEQAISKLPFVLHGEGPLSANIAHVFSDTMVSLSVIDSGGNQHPRASVSFIPDDTPPVPDGNAYATWMPFQLGQAAQQQTLVQSPGEPAPLLSGAVGSTNTTDASTTQTADSTTAPAATDPTQPAA